MAREQTLLERITASGPGGARGRYAPTAEENLEALMESIRANLGRLLNARQGMSETVPDYGLPALTDLFVGSDGAIRRAQDAIRTVLEKYEPRLRHVRVTHRADEGTTHRLVFRIDGTMVGRSGEHRVWYETSLNTSGEVDVAG
jgi:type VI secretion system protein